MGTHDDPEKSLLLKNGASAVSPDLDTQRKNAAGLVTTRRRIAPCCVRSACAVDPAAVFGFGRPGDVLRQTPGHCQRAPLAAAVFGSHRASSVWLRAAAADAVRRHLPPATSWTGLPSVGTTFFFIETRGSGGVRMTIRLQKRRFRILPGTGRIRSLRPHRHPERTGSCRLKRFSRRFSVAGSGSG